MIGSRVGSKLSFVGSAVGSAGDDEGTVSGIPGVTRDATSLKYFPATAGEWTTFLAAVGLSGLGNPNSLWNCQEASGNLTDVIGGLTLTAAGTPTYQQTISGYARKGLKTVGVSDRFAAAALSGPSPATTSQTWVWIQALSATPAGTRFLAGISNAATQFQAGVTNTQVQSLIVSGATAVGAIATGTGVQPLALVYDRTNSRAEQINGSERLVGTYSALVADGFKGVGANGGSGTPMSILYGFMYSGAGGEMSAANLKLLLQALGYTITW